MKTASPVRTTCVLVCTQVSCAVAEPLPTYAHRSTSRTLVTDFMEYVSFEGVVDARSWSGLRLKCPDNLIAIPAVQVAVQIDIAFFTQQPNRAIAHEHVGATHVPTPRT